MKHIGALLGVVSVLLIGNTRAWAQHAHADLLVGSDSDGSGNLVIDYPVDERPVVRVTDSGFPGVFTSTDPGFMPAQDEPLESVYELNLNTQVEFEITDIDPNVSLQLGITPLDSVGDVAVVGTHDNSDPELSGLHTHPTFQLILTPPAPDVFAEGTFSFRVREGTTGPGYGDSSIHKLTLSNGYLPPLEPANEDDAKAARKCRKGVAGQMKKLVAKEYDLLSKCLDKIFAVEQLGGSLSAAVKACDIDPLNDSGLVGKLAAARTKAITKLDDVCDRDVPSSFAPFAANNVKTHLGMGSCRAEELAGSTNNSALDEIAETLSECEDGLCVAGPNKGMACTTPDNCNPEGVEAAVAAVFPCLVASHGE